MMPAGSDNTIAHLYKVLIWRSAFPLQCDVDECGFDTEPGNSKAICCLFEDIYSYMNNKFEVWPIL